MYKQIIKMMMWDYLSSKEPDSEKKSMIINDISGLWRNLEFSYNENNSMLSLIQWTDVWLNGLLQNLLVSKYYEKSLKRNEKKCLNYLKEIFLNEGKHISVIKRQSEVMQINAAISREICECKKKLKKYVYDEENNVNAVNEGLRDILDAMNEPCDWKCWEENLGHGFIKRAIDRVIDEKPNISSSMVVPVDFSLGSQMDEVFIYDAATNAHQYNMYSDIETRLQNERRAFPYYYVYIRLKNPPQSTEKQIEFFADLREEIGQEIGRDLNRLIYERYQFEGRG